MQLSQHLPINVPVAQLEEHDPSKIGVASSILVWNTIFIFGNVVEWLKQRLAKTSTVVISFTSSNLVVSAKISFKKCLSFFKFLV